MSRVGKQTVTIPEKTEVNLSEGTLTVKGPLGTLSKKFKDAVEIKIEGNEITFIPKKDDIFSRALWGTTASHVKNMVDGVNNKFEKKLEIQGVGYKAEMKGNVVVLSLGFSHTIEMKIPEGLDVSIEKNTITINGIDKELVGKFAADIRSKKKPEPYKGKGIRYSGEYVRSKQGKKTA